MVSVSIIVPVYNAEKYIERWYQTMCSQNMADYEVLLIEDGSVDNSLSMCRRIVNQDSRFKLICIKNQGAGAARNVGIQHANGEYIGFSDIDDTFDVSIYEKMYDAAKNNDVEVVKCGFKTIDSKTKNILSKVLPIEGIYSNKSFLDNLVLGKGDGAVWNLLIKASIAKSLRFPEGQIMEDIAFCANLATKVSHVYGIAEPLYHYWQYSTSVMHRDMDRRLYDTGLAHMKIAEYARVLECMNACGAAFTVVLQAYLNLETNSGHSSVTNEELKVLWKWLFTHKKWFVFEKRMGYLKKMYYSIPFINRCFFINIKRFVDNLRNK